MVDNCEPVNRWGEVVGGKNLNALRRHLREGDLLTMILTENSKDFKLFIYSLVVDLKRVNDVISVEVADDLLRTLHRAVCEISSVCLDRYPKVGRGGAVIDPDLDKFIVTRLREAVKDLPLGVSADDFTREVHAEIVRGLNFIYRGINVVAANLKQSHDDILDALEMNSLLLYLQKVRKFDTNRRHERKQVEKNRRGEGAQATGDDRRANVSGLFDFDPEKDQFFTGMKLSLDWFRSLILRDGEVDALFRNIFDLKGSVLQFKPDFLAKFRKGNYVSVQGSVLYQSLNEKGQVEERSMSLLDFVNHFLMYLGVLDQVKPYTMETREDYLAVVKERVRLHADGSIDELQREARRSVKWTKGEAQGSYFALSQDLAKESERIVLVCDHVGFGVKNINWLIEQWHQLAEAKTDEDRMEVVRALNDKGTNYLRLVENFVEMAIRSEFDGDYNPTIDVSGGDELVIVINGLKVSDEAAWEAFLNKLMSTFNLRIADIHGYDQAMNEEGIKAMLKRADEALNEAKAAASVGALVRSKVTKELKK